MHHCNILEHAMSLQRVEVHPQRLWPHGPRDSLSGRPVKGRQKWIQKAAVSGAEVLAGICIDLHLFGLRSAKRDRQKLEP